MSMVDDNDDSLWFSQIVTYVFDSIMKPVCNERSILLGGRYRQVSL